jgi:hypothetical protein
MLGGEAISEEGMMLLLGDLGPLTTIAVELKDVKQPWAGNTRPPVTKKVARR